jgi:hypothetical protein
MHPENIWNSKTAECIFATDLEIDQVVGEIWTEINYLDGFTQREI